MTTVPYHETSPHTHTHHHFYRLILHFLKVCRSLYDGFNLETQGTDNEFVKTHWIEATSGDVEEVEKYNPGNVGTISIKGLSSNTVYNITTKYKVHI